MTINAGWIPKLTHAIWFINFVYDTFIIFEAKSASSKRIPTQHKDAHLIT